MCENLNVCFDLRIVEGFVQIIHLSVRTLFKLDECAMILISSPILSFSGICAFFLFIQQTGKCG